eukprot:1150580-Pelagomonas_calceolata.AAC.12
MKVLVFYDKVQKHFISKVSKFGTLEKRVECDEGKEAKSCPKRQKMHTWAHANTHTHMHTHAKRAVPALRSIPGISGAQIHQRHTHTLAFLMGCECDLCLARCMRRVVAVAAVAAEGGTAAAAAAATAAGGAGGCLADPDPECSRDLEGEAWASERWSLAAPGSGGCGCCWGFGRLVLGSSTPVSTGGLAKLKCRWDSQASELTACGKEGSPI